MEDKKEQAIGDYMKMEALTDAINIVYDDLEKEVDSKDPDASIVERLQRTLAVLKIILIECSDSPKKIREDLGGALDAGTKTQDKLLKEGFTVIRIPDRDPVIKYRPDSKSAWKILKKFDTLAARNRYARGLLNNSKVVEC